jgi:hypothetical protein
MHPNGLMLQRLFTALDVHDHPTMAECYAPAASFRDIAFDLEGKAKIHAMWQMICEGSDLRASFEILHADDGEGRVALVDHYTFSDTKFKVRNVIDARFRFENGLIVQHHDHGGLRGFLAGRFRFVRARAAEAKLKAFMDARSAQSMRT